MGEREESLEGCCRPSQLSRMTEALGSLEAETVVFYYCLCVREGRRACVYKRFTLSKLRCCLFTIAELERCISAMHISCHIDWDVCHPASDHFTWNLVRFWIVWELIKEADPVEAVRSILALLDLTGNTRSASWVLPLFFSYKQEDLWYFHI